MKRMGFVGVGILTAFAVQGCGIVASLTGTDAESGGSATWSTPVVQSAPTEAPALRGNPFRGSTLHVPAQTGAADAAASMDASDAAFEDLQRLADVPTAVWLLPEAYPLGAVGPHVEGIIWEAQQTATLPVFVVYGIPGRDCIHGYSGGGLEPDQYLDWVQEIADAAGRGSVVILEPDALASAGSCSLGHDRIALLGDAVGRLENGPVTYVDAGHSGWQSVGTTVERLRQVGVDRVRGFSLNVSGYAAEQSEASYGTSVAAALGEAHFVVDTGRGGAGTASTWCNPAGQAVGADPGEAKGATSSAYDARLWVKPPGESDGECGGGPAAGEFWTERALEMVRAAGW